MHLKSKAEAEVYANGYADLVKKKRERAREGSDSDEDEEASSSSSLPRSKSIIMDYLLKTTESDKEISQTEVEIKGMEIEIQKQE